MAITPKALVAGIQLPVAAVALYNCPVGTIAVVKQASIVNTSAAAVSATIYVVRAGDTAGDNNTLLKDKNLAVAEVYRVDEMNNVVLNAGDMIQAIAGVATSLTFMVHGYEVVS